MTSEGSDQSQDQLVKKRSSKACDNCRVTKSKCERDSADRDCDRCVEGGLACTYETPTRRRGPPKGYFNLVESRVHALEAIVGVLLSNPDLAVRDMFNALDQDPFASSVLLQVASGAFGPRALAEYATQPSAESSGCQRSPQRVATNDWQLQAIQVLIANPGSVDLQPALKHLSSPPFDSASIGLGDAQGIPQPSVSQENNQPLVPKLADDFCLGLDYDVAFSQLEPPGDTEPDSQSLYGWPCF